MPPDDALPARLGAVLDVVCLIFNEGYAASAGDAHVRRSLCDEAVRLAAVIAELMPDEPEALGLQALLLAHHARRDARVDAAGARCRPASPSSRRSCRPTRTRSRPWSRACPTSACG